MSLGHATIVRRCRGMPPSTPWFRRALARPFTYLADEPEKGAVVSVPFGRAHRRGVVVALEDDALLPTSSPCGRPRARGRVAGARRPRALLAELYGSTRARPRPRGASARTRRAARGGRSPHDVSAGGPPAALTEPRRGRSSGSQARWATRLTSSSTARPGAGRPRSTSAHARPARPRARRDRARAGDRAHPADGRTLSARASATASPSSTRVDRGRAARRAGADRRRRRARGRRGTLGDFAPVGRLGLVFVDEEHDGSYKQDSDPRYDARTVAAKRAALERAVVVYGSATPRPESWARLERLDLAGASAPRFLP